MVVVSALEAVLKRDRLVIVASLAALGLLAWLYLFHLAAGMDATPAGSEAMPNMPGMDMPGMGEMQHEADPAMGAGGVTQFALLAAMWIIMMIGMMLPSATPTVLLFAALERKRWVEGPVISRTALFLFGYFLLWGGFSLAAALAQMLLSRAGLLSSEMAGINALFGGGVLIIAGLYEFSPLKETCLSHCRSPLEWLPRHWRPGRAGALRMGAEHGAFCLGCCWVLMLLLFAGGVMNLVWVAAIAAIVLAEKLFPYGRTVSRIAGAVLIGWGAFLVGGAAT
jgi:predicted metal-binding membrane protein